MKKLRACTSRREEESEMKKLRACTSRREEESEMKKLRACTSRRDDDGASSSSGLPPELLLFEVLTRVPAKSLMRFKSVSKLFCSVISSDPQFVEAHQARSRTRSGGGGLLISFPDPTRSEQHYFFASHGGRSLSHQLILPLSEQGDEEAVVTQVIDGLVCFYAPDGCVAVCNVFTREIRSLPVSSFHGEEGEDDLRGTIPRYYFGFDPVEKEYKVLNVCTRRGRGRRGVVPKCEILTLGKDSSWRRLDAAPPHVLHGQSVCINGVLHWMAEDTSEDTAQAFHFLVVAFDLDQETFRLLPPVRELTRDHHLVQVPGMLAVASTTECLFGGDLGLWTFAEDGLGSWVKDRTRFPPVVRELGCFAVVGALPNGEILLTSTKLSSSHSSACIMPIFSCDMRWNKWHRIKIVDQFPPTVFNTNYQQARICISYHLENIIPLRDLVPEI